MSNAVERPIGVLVVEDVATIRELLIHLISSAEGMRVVGVARDGLEAVEAVENLRPDVVTMDINMPRLNGLDATRRIMERWPTPVVIVSGSWNASEVEMTFRAIDAGAVAMLERPHGPGHPEHDESAKELVMTVRAMAGIKVVRRWPKREHVVPVVRAPSASAPVIGGAEIKLVAVGASTGGPAALQGLLERLPRDFPAPVLVVQHMAAGFISGFAEWLGKSTELTVTIADHGESVVPGRVYIAPDGLHMGVDRSGRIALVDGPPQQGLKPAVAHLFQSVADNIGRNTAAVLLTGMGTDGAAELRKLRDAGASTFAQDKESSIVHGMPGEAIRLDAARWVLPPPKIAEYLINLVGTGAMETKR